MDKIKSVLKSFEDVKDIRYIVLTLRQLTSSLTNNQSPVINYYSSSTIIYPVDDDYCSKHIVIHNAGLILFWANQIIRKRVTDKPNSQHGIAIATE